MNTARRILVIDDNQDTALATSRVLKLSGHQVEVAYDGVRGLEIAHEFRPEVVLLDIRLPGATDGYAVARSLRAMEQFRGTLLVAITGFGRQEDARRAREAGFDLHLTKPVDAIALAQAIAMGCVETSSTPTATGNARAPR